MNKCCAERFAEGFIKGRTSVFRENKSGCSCIFDDRENIIVVCDAHQELIEQALRRDERNLTK